MIHHGDCLDVMASMDPDSIDAIVTDPPYGIRFMGKHWDHGVPGVDFWTAMLRVAKPSTYLLTFGGTRTVHRIATNAEDAGWVIRDMLVWGYASGFPKSKASLKPAWEPIVMARKPGPLRMLAIDECRIPGAPPSVPQPTFGTGHIYGMKTGEGRNGEMSEASGRWPANIVLTDPIFDGGIEGVVGGGEATTGGSILGDKEYADIGYHGNLVNRSRFDSYGDTGTYSRFFLIPKAARSDREPVLGGPTRSCHVAFGGDLCVVHNVKHESKQQWNGPLDGPRPHTAPDYQWQPKARANVHPTVKPTDLMRHLVRLVTPAGGTVLDPFLGSGTTGLAAEMEGFAWVGIEREAEYVAIAEARLNGTQKGLAL